MLNDNMSHAEQEDEVIFETKVFDVVKRYQIGHSGKKLTRFVIRNRGAVAILPILDDGRIVLVRQYRSPAQRYIYEIPAGTREIGEEPLITATRELIEETGYHAERIWLMTHFFSSPGIFQEELYLFKATGLTPGDSHLEDGEDLEVRLFTKDELRRMICAGEIEDGKTLLALLTLFTPDEFFSEQRN